MRRRLILTLLSSAALMAAISVENTCLAGGEGFVVHALGDRLVTGTGDDTPGGQQFGQRVLGSRLHSSGVDRNPSFFSFSTAPAGLDPLPVGEFVYWDFLPLTIDGATANLFHWDSTGPVEFSPATLEKLSLFDVTRTVPATVDGSAAAIPGDRLGSVTDDFLSLHAHNFWALQGEGGDPLLGGGADPAAGVYLTAIRLRVDGYIPTKPLFVALATSDLSESVLDNEALPWIEANIDDLILRGDYDFNGVVDVADYELWRNQYGATTPQPVDVGEADGNRDGQIDAADYVIWRDHWLANLSAAEPIAIEPVAIPEPSSTILISLTVVAAASLRRR